MSDFNGWFAEYPRRSGIGLARQAYLNQIFFRKADPEQMLSACKQFALKMKREKTEERFIPYPAKWLESQMYLDEDLQPKAPIEPLTGWRLDFEREMGENAYRIYISRSTYEDGTLRVPKPFMVDMLKNNYGVQMKRLGVKEIRT